MLKKYASLEKNNHIDFILLFLTILTALFVFLGVIISFNYIKNHLDNSMSIVNDVAIKSSSNIEAKINDDFSNLISISNSISSKFNSIQKINTKSISKNKFSTLGVASLSGEEFIITSAAKPVKIDSKYISKELLNKVLSGQNTFDLIANNGKQDELIYLVPIYNKSKISAILFATSNINSFKSSLTIYNFNTVAFSNIINLSGNFVINKSSYLHGFNSIFDDNILFISPSKEKVLNVLKSNKSTLYWTFVNKQLLLNSFVPIKNTNCFVLVSVPSSMVSLVNFEAFLLLLAVFAVVIYLIYLMFRRVKTIYRHTYNSMIDFAFTDDVTGGPNSNKFLLEAKKVFDNPLNSDNNYAMVLVDINKFKVINEVYGYDSANKILKDIYNIISSSINSTDLSTRYFAATFAFLIKYKDLLDVYNTVDKILAEVDAYNSTTINNSVNIDNGVISKIVLSFGVYLVEDKTLSINNMCDRALLAKRSIELNLNKHISFYDEALRTKLLKDKNIEDEMKSALERNEFVMYLQPKYDMKTLMVISSESLVRWIHPTKGFIPPCDFIPLFEQNGFIIKLDYYIWEEACKTIKKWINWGLTPAPISVNVSRIHLSNDDFVDVLLHLVKKYNIPPQLLELELTESACFNDIDKFLDLLHSLKKCGFNIAMDDFGAGYSSLNMLRKIPVDILKLDKEFITSSTADDKGKVVVKHILEMAKELNLTTVAEGVETKIQADFLANAGCDIAQGFLFARPMPIIDFEKIAFSTEIEQIDLQKKQQESF